MQHPHATAAPLTPKQKALMVAQYAATLAAGEEAYVVVFLDQEQSGLIGTWITHNLIDGYEQVAEHIRCALVSPAIECHVTNGGRA